VGDLGDVPCLMFFRWPRKWIMGLWTCEARIMRVGIMLAGGLGWCAAKVCAEGRRYNLLKTGDGG
jgi:hypothetical protein